MTTYQHSWMQGRLAMKDLEDSERTNQRDAVYKEENAETKRAGHCLRLNLSAALSFGCSTVMCFESSGVFLDDIVPNC